jgi:hypothetical protein
MRGRVSGKDEKFQSNVTLEFLAGFQFLESAVVRLSDCAATTTLQWILLFYDSILPWFIPSGYKLSPHAMNQPRIFFDGFREGTLS